MTTDSRRAVSFALLFAVVWTAVCVGAFMSPSAAGPVVAHVRPIVNFGGGWLSSLALHLFHATTNGSLDVLGWALFAVTEFVGAFLQGVGYTVLAVAFVRCWRRNQARALAGVALVAVVLAAAYKAGEAVYERANCVSTVERFSDGIETFTECGASYFGGGQMWMGIAFALVVLAVALRGESMRST